VIGYAISSEGVLETGIPAEFVETWMRPSYEAGPDCTIEGKL